METICLEEALALVCGEEDILNELLLAYIKDRRFSKDEFKSLVQKDALAAASYVHYFKGAARQLCAKKTAASGQVLEDILRGKRAGSLESALDDFMRDYDELVHFIEERMA